MKECPSTAYAGETALDREVQQRIPVMAAQRDIHRHAPVA